MLILMQKHWTQDFLLFLMYFFISKVKISLQMDKFPGNDLAKMPIFSYHVDRSSHQIY